MTTPLETLYAIQVFDSAADQLRHRRAHLPERIRLAEVERAIAGFTASETAASARRETALAEQESLEADVGSIEKRGRELDRRLTTSSVPREIQAFNDELAVLHDKQRELEDRELALMEVVEVSDAEISAAAKERGPLDEEATRLRSEVADADATIETQLAELEERRKVAVVDVEADDLALYERMRARLGGVALARLVQGRCDGCHVALSASEVDRIRREPPDARVECEHCGRLLVR
jgi:predicted  nucleic acid-binding Zn-ribbon protein